MKVVKIAAITLAALVFLLIALSVGYVASRDTEVRRHSSMRVIKKLTYTMSFGTINYCVQTETNGEKSYWYVPESVYNSIEVGDSVRW